MAVHRRFVETDDVLLVPVSYSHQDAIIPIACLLLLGSFLAGGSLAVATGYWHVPQGGKEGINCSMPTIQMAGGLAGIALLGLALYLVYHAGNSGDDPFVFDRHTDQLRRGAKPLCRLSEIRQVRFEEERGEGDSVYSLSLVLADSRRVGFGPFLRCHEKGKDSLEREIEAFLKLSTPEL